MNGVIKKIWLKALRSGEYEQGIGGLRTATGFCCLGVLCDIQKAMWKRTYSSNFRPVAKIPEYGFMPSKFTAGLDLYDEHKLADMNDGMDSYHKHSFYEIANYIEENL